MQWINSDLFRKSSICYGISFEKNLYRKKYRYQFWKIFVSKKVSVSVSKKIGINRAFWHLIELFFGLFLSILDPKCWTWLESYESWHYNNDIIQSTNFDLKSFRFGFHVFLWNWFRKKIGIGFQKNWYRKKYWNWFRKKLSLLVSEKMALKKVSDSVSKKNGIGKKFRIRFLLYFGFRHTLMDNGLDDGLEVMVVKILTIS